MRVTESGSSLGLAMAFSAGNGVVAPRPGGGNAGVGAWAFRAPYRTRSRWFLGAGQSASCTFGHSLLLRGFGRWLIALHLLDLPCQRPADFCSRPCSCCCWALCSISRVAHPVALRDRSGSCRPAPSAGQPAGASSSVDLVSSASLPCRDLLGLLQPSSPAPSA